MVRGAVGENMASRNPRTGLHGRNVSIGLNPVFNKSTQPSFANRFSKTSNMTRTLLGENRNKITTYSKKRPIQFVNKAHFLTPDTPVDLLEQNGSSQLPTVQKQFPQNKHQKLEGGSYSSLLLQQASWQEGSGHALSATRSIMRGSSLALRNISNIPIEKTLSTTPCRESHISQSTPGRRQSENPNLLTPHSARKQRLVQMGRSNHRASQRRVRNVVPVASLTCKSNNATCHSMKTMSTCSQVEISRDIINRCSNAQSLMSMSLCSSIGLTKEDGTPKERQSDICTGSMGAQQPVNSTFGDGSHLEFRDTIPQDLSAIIEPCQTEQDDDGDDTLTPEKIHDIPAAGDGGGVLPYMSHVGRRQSENPNLLTPHSARKERLVQMGRSNHQASQRRVRNVVPVASLTCKSNNATCHSMKTMSTCTQVEISRDIINRCSNAQSLMSMSLCSSIGLTKEDGTPKERQSDICTGSMGAQQPVNSTFGDGSHLEFRDTIPQDLSAIIEPCQTEQDDDGDDTLTPEKIHNIPAAEPVGLLNSSCDLNAKNMTPTKKHTLDVSCDKATEQQNKQSAVSCFLTSTGIESKDVPCGPTSSTPTDPGKIPPVVLDISEIDCDQTEAAVTTKKQDVNMEDLLEFDPLPLEVSSTVDAHIVEIPAPEKDITPESEQEKYLLTATPQHKRRLAYVSTTSELIPSCCLLADWPQKRKSCVTKCKHMATWNAREHDSLPTDVLCLL